VAGVRHTKIQMLIYTLVLIPITLAPSFLGLASMIYGLVAGILGGFFLLSCLKVLRSDDFKHAKIMFGYSVFYLFALFLAVMIL